MAARLAGLPVGSACDGDGICGRCGLRPLRGRFTAPTAGENRVKEANDVDPDLRLSCLTGVVSDAVVTADYW